MYTFISTALENWNAFYSNHAVIRTLISFLHIGALVIGGGCAIYVDRMTLAASRREPAERQVQLLALRNSHRTVVVSLVVVVVSGLLLFAADTGTFLHSTFFWIKMGLVFALLANGLALNFAERKAEIDAIAGWRTLRITSSLSLVLWLITTLAGAALPNIG